MSDTDVHAAAAAAYESVTGEATSTPATETTSTPPPVEATSDDTGTAPDLSGQGATPSQETPAQLAQRQRDASGRFAKGATNATVAPKAVQPTKVSLSATRPPETPPDAQSHTPAPGTERPPSTWKVGARDLDEWAKVPAPIKEEIWRREREVGSIGRELQQTRQFAQSFQEVVTPYIGMIRAEGGEPLQAIGSLLQTAAALRTAPPAHKARLVADIVRNYGIPIEALDAELAGQGPPPGQGQGFDPSQMRQQLKQEIWQDFQAQSQARLSENAGREVESFIEGKEFGTDLRQMMGRLMAAYAEDGEPLTLDQAYELASKSHPEVSKVFLQREAKKTASQANASTERARAASSSIRSQPVTAPVVIQNGTPKRGFDGIKQAATAAWNEVESR